MERDRDRTKVDPSEDRAHIIARAALSAVIKLSTKEKPLDVEEMSAMIQSDPSMDEILAPVSEWKKFQKDQILRQKKEIETLEDQLQKISVKRRATVAELDAAERQVSRTRDFMHRAFLALIQYVNTGRNGQLENALARIQEMLKIRAPINELDTAFQQLKDSAFKSGLEMETREEAAPASKASGFAFLKHPHREPDSPLSRFRQKYLEIIDELKLFLDRTALKDIAEIEERLGSALGTYDLLEIQKELRMLLKAFVHRVGLEREQAADFILDIGKRLAEVERQILICTDSLRETGDAGARFTTAVEQEMTHMQGAVDVTKNLEELKSKVIDSIGTIKKAIEKKRKDEWERARKTDEEISSLHKSIERMKLEIASSKKRNERLEAEVLVDPLTQTHNHRAYEQRLEAELKRCQTHRRVFSILLLGVDRFKQINDRYGHPVGDICLKGIAGRIRPLLRDEDFLSRYEGDEFVMILPETPAQDAGMLAEKIRSHIEKTRFLHRKEKVRVTVSIGIAEVDPDNPSAGDLFGRAEKALYRAKEDGRNRAASA